MCYLNIYFISLCEYLHVFVQKHEASDMKSMVYLVSPNKLNTKQKK